MAKSPRSSRPSDLVDPEAPVRGGRKVRTPAYAAVTDVAGGEPATPDDLIDVEAPPQGGERVDTAAYAGPASASSKRAIANDLVDVEAPPAGGAAVDTAAYAAPARRGVGKPKAAPASVERQAPPPPPPSEPAAEPPARDDDPLDGEAGGAPPRAGPELGGGPPAMSAAGDGEDLLDRAGRAALRLAADRPWPEVSLRDVAQEAGVGFAELYARAAGKTALLLRLSARLDRLALERIADDDQPSARDRLFEALMSRLEVMGPDRDALLAIARSERLSLASAAPRTVRALLEGAGVDTSGGRGALRTAALIGVWGRTLQVWRDDEGALNRTMAEIDKLLTRADKRLSRVGAGF